MIISKEMTSLDVSVTKVLMVVLWFRSIHLSKCFRQASMRILLTQV